MEIKELWYRLVAPSLLREIDSLAKDLGWQAAKYFKNQQEISQLKSKVHYKDLIIRGLEEDRRGGEMRCVLSAHERGSKSRIRDLEGEVDHLLKIIRDLKNPKKKEVW